MGNYTGSGTIDPDRIKRRVKIVCTLGPASNASDVIERMLIAGMDIARLNLSYGTFAEHRELINRVRQASEKLGLATGILADLPGLKRKTGSIREAFGEHLRFALAEKVTFIALSFISSARQVKEFKEMLQGESNPPPLIVKIEQAGALEEIEGILERSEGIMVARGDLGLQIRIEKVPLAQKMLIKRANHRGKPVITATQMLESMIDSPTPTRAEATDIANAVLDGTDAVMLSGETAVGRYPVESVETMARIALEAESALPYEQILQEKWHDVLPEVNDAAARAACQIAQQIGARAIVAATTGGTTALRVSKYRPRQPIIAVTASPTVRERLSVVWGALPLIRPESANLDEAFDRAAETAITTGIAEKGDLIVVTAGLPLSIPGSTNLVKVHRI